MFSARSSERARERETKVFNLEHVLSAYIRSTTYVRRKEGPKYVYTITLWMWRWWYVSWYHRRHTFKISLLCGLGRIFFCGYFFNNLTRLQLRALSNLARFYDHFRATKKLYFNRGNGFFRGKKSIKEKNAVGYTYYY